MADNPTPTVTRRVFDHMPLPPHMKEIGALYDEVAEKLMAKIPPSPECTAAMEALWDAKDAALRARVARPARPSPAHEWDGFAQRWTERSGTPGPAIGHKATAA